MFEIYTYEAIYALNEAQKIAQQLSSPSVEPEHILLGLRKEGVGSAARFLRKKKISFDVLKKLLDLNTNPDLNETKIGLSENSNKILDSVYNEAKESNCSLIGQKELFLKLIELSDSVATTLNQLNAIPTEQIVERLDSPDYETNLELPPPNPIVMQSLKALNLTEMWCLHSFFIQTGSLREISIKNLDATRVVRLLDYLRQKFIVIVELIDCSEEAAQPIRVKIGPTDLTGWNWDEDKITFDLMPLDFHDTRLKITILGFMADAAKLLNMPIALSDEGATDPMVVLNPDGSMEIHQELELVEQSDL